MEQEIWQEDQPVLVSDLNRAQSTKEDAITSRMGDEFYAGVVPDSQMLAESVPFLITVVTSTTINVGTGVAYDVNGQRIVIPGPALVTYNGANPTTQTDNGIGGTTLTPISTGSLTIPIPLSTICYVYITYINAIDPTIFTISEYNNSRLFISGTDGYRIDIQTVEVPPFPASMFLGAVSATQTLSTTGQPVFNLKPGNLLALVPQATQTLGALGLPYAAGQLVTFGRDPSLAYSDHVSGIGTGTVTPTNVHGLSIADISGTSTAVPQLFMNSGISNAPQPPEGGYNTSALYGQIFPGGGSPIPPGYGYDNFLIYPLSGSQTLLVNGQTITASAFTQALGYLFYFISPTGVPLSAGVYTIYYNAGTNQLLLAANGSPTNTAYSVQGQNSLTFFTSNVLPISTVEANPNNFLLWQITWAGLSGPYLGICPSCAVDLRQFGTIGSTSLQRDALTDTVTIQHNVDITADPLGVGLGNLNVAGNANVEGALTAGEFDPIYVPPIGNSLKANAVTTATSNTLATFTADVLSVQGVILDAVNVTANIAVSGANGLDTGSKTTNTWYAIHVITNDTSSVVAALLSLSATAPTLPSGYTRFRRVGWVRNNSSNVFNYFLSVGEVIMYLSTIPNLGTPTGTVSFAAYIPPTSRMGKFTLYGSSGAGGSDAATFTTPGFSNSLLVWYTGAPPNPNIGLSGSSVDFMTDASQNVSISGGAFNLFVPGYYDPI